MRNWWRKRRARKALISQQVKKDKEATKAKKIIWQTLPDDEKRAAKESIKQLKKSEKQTYKVELKKLDKKERREHKKEHKIYRKIKNRPRRLIGWSLVGLFILFIGVKFGPTVTSMYAVMSGSKLHINTETSAGERARNHGNKISEEVANEGIVLLKNEDKSLPLEDKKINVFGVSAFNFRYGGGGSGGSDTSNAVNLFDGLKNAGIEYNSKLYDFYQELPEVAKAEAGKNESGLLQVAKSMLAPSDDDELAISYLKDKVVKESKDFSENALIVLTSSGVESSDMSKEELELTANKKALIKKICENFENVTIVVNAGNALELGYLEEFPQIKSVLWVGTPGPFGTKSLGNVLAGNLNPSGRLTDTYVYDNDSAPATENFGNYQYDNLDQAFVNYQENIYIGYRFYETYYEGNEAGYKKAVLYPYGHGLSYSTFDWKVTKKDFSKDKMTVSVEVTNVGDVAGKDVVQLYYSAPYSKGGLEKSAIVLGAYGKTKLLKPGEKETLELSYATNDMASYDQIKEEAYVLDAGNYQIKLARNVHDIAEVFDYEIAEQKIIKEDAVTGTVIENKFEKSLGDLDYLSRSDWEGTYPSDKKMNHTAPQFVLDEVAKKTTDSKLTMPIFGADNGIQLADLKGLEHDDPKWEKFLDQFTAEELIDYMANGAYQTNEIKRLGVPSSVLLDGPAGINSFFKPVKAAAFPTEIVLAATWNNELAYEMGEAVGKEAKAYGVHGWYAPAVNLHRTSMGGRNFEYFSEDPLLSGKMGASVISGAQNQGIIVFMKHFAMNDQETNARSGLYVWGNEQSIRELHLRPFEIAVKEGKTLGTMSSFSLINGKWAGGNSELLNDILRDEWGFEGVVSSDAVFGFMHADKAVVAGNDLMLDIMSIPTNTKRLEKAYKADPSGTAIGLRTSAHNTMYALLQTYLFDGK